MFQDPSLPSPSHLGAGAERARTGIFDSCEPPTISFVYPVFNEEDNLIPLVHGTIDVARPRFSNFEIILVNDASTDRSQAVAENLSFQFPEVRILKHSQNRGLGGALRTGFAASEGDYVLYMDSDLPVAFADVSVVLDAWLKKIARPDMLAGWRIGRAEGIRRDIQSYAYNRFLRLLFGIRARDINFAFKLFRRDIFPDLVADGSFIDAEMWLEATRKGLTVEEVGLRYQPRVAGCSTIGGFRVIPKLLREMARYRRARWHGERAVVFHADDFGFCKSVDEGIIAAHEAGVVMAASLMSCGATFLDAVEYSKNHPELDVGLHLTLCGSKAVCEASQIPTLADSEGNLPRDHKDFLIRWFRGKISPADIHCELKAQIQKALACGLTIQHFDSHQHLHALAPIRSIVRTLSKEFHIPRVRRPDESGHWHFSRPARSLLRLALSWTCRMGNHADQNAGLTAPDHFSGFLDAGHLTPASLQSSIQSLKPGLTEFCCHPRTPRLPNEDFHEWGGPPGQELAALLNPALRASLAEEGIRITNYSAWNQRSESVSLSASSQK